MTNLNVLKRPSPVPTDHISASGHYRLSAALAAVCMAMAISMSGSVFAKKICDDGSSPPCNKPDTGEIGSNNLSFPLILSENIGPAGLPADGAWRSAEIIDPVDACIGEEGVVTGTPVPPEYLCYYGRHITVVSETGAIEFDGDPKIWWLQKRPENFWKTLSVGHDVSTPLTVTSVDVGDLLESSPSIQARQIRVEFNLLQNALIPHDNGELSALVADWGTGDVPSPCVIPDETGESVGCFAALGMSGAVPGTEQSGNEMQGTEFFGSGALVDPTQVRTAVDELGNPVPVHALVYSHCARLLIQKVPDSVSPYWEEALGQWAGVSVGSPMVNIAAYTGDWSVETTSSGGTVYGYNWNAKTASTGTYRLTMVLDDNNPTQGPVCNTTLATRFENGGTTIVNQGENNQSTLVYAGDPDLGDEGGLVYIDLRLTTKGGGKNR